MRLSEHGALSSVSLTLTDYVTSLLALVTDGISTKGSSKSTVVSITFGGLRYVPRVIVTDKLRKLQCCSHFRVGRHLYGVSRLPSGDEIETCHMGSGDLLEIVVN